MRCAAVGQGGMGEPDSYACDYFLCEQADPDDIEGLRKMGIG